MRLLRLVTSSVAVVVGALIMLIVLLRVHDHVDWTGILPFIAGGLCGVAVWWSFPPEKPPETRQVRGTPEEWRRSFRRRRTLATVCVVVFLSFDQSLRWIDRAGTLVWLLTVATFVIGVPIVLYFVLRCPACGRQLEGRAWLARSRRCAACGTLLSTEEPPR